MALGVDQEEKEEEEMCILVASVFESVSLGSIL